MRALGRLASAAVAVAWAWMLYQLARWLLVADRGLGCSVELAVNVAPLRPVGDDIDDDPMGPYRRGMGE